MSNKRIHIVICKRLYYQKVRGREREREEKLIAEKLYSKNNFHGFNFAETWLELSKDKQYLCCLYFTLGS